MLWVHFAYPEAQAALEAIKEVQKNGYNIKNIWRLAKVEEKIRKMINKQYDGDIAKYHADGQKEIDDERILDLVNQHNMVR